jgi:hypothetical protein
MSERAEYCRAGGIIGHSCRFFSRFVNSMNRYCVQLVTQYVTIYPAHFSLKMETGNLHVNVAFELRIFKFCITGQFSYLKKNGRNLIVV